MQRLPIQQLGEFLLVTIQVDLHDQLVTTLHNDLGERLAETDARGVLIDISALQVVESFVARMLGQVAAMSRLLGAETVLVGMQPAVAITLAEMGISLSGVLTALDAQKGMERLQASMEQGRANAPDPY
jgi:rsbT antagonist protein RsbS